MSLLALEMIRVVTLDKSLHLFVALLCRLWDGDPNAYQAQCEEYCGQDEFAMRGQLKSINSI